MYANFLAVGASYTLIITINNLKFQLLGFLLQDAVERFYLHEGLVELPHELAELVQRRHHLQHHRLQQDDIASREFALY